jgi:RHS repeat-associated protein
VQVDYEYYDWDEQGGRLSGLKSGFPNIPTGVQNLEYNYDLNGNVAGILDTTNGATQMLSFGYDLLDRLTSAVATGGQGTYNQSYSYDPTSGNLASKAGVSYTYASPSHRHAVTATSNGKNFSYDANGNMTNHAGDVLTYNGENHLTQASVGGVLTTYGYDGDAQQVLVKNGSETKIYIGRHFEVRISPSIQPPTISPPPATPCLSGSVTCFYLPVTLSGVTIADPPAQREWRSYYYAGMSRIAVRVQGDTQPAGGKAFYLLGDHLGSTSVTLDEGGGKIGELRYYPWGETRWESGTTQTAYKFTGQRLDGYINLYWYNSRWFDPALSRFAQADTIVPEAIQGNQAWDRYAYVNNSPIQYTDPGGQSVDCGLGEEECQAGAYVTPSLPRLLYLSTDSIILDGGPGTGSYGQNAEDEWTGFSDSGESANDELAGLIALPGLLDWLLVFLRDNTDIRAYIGNAPEVSGRVYYDLIIDDKVMIIGVTILNTTYEAVGVTSIRETSMFQTKQLYPPDGIFISSPSYAIARPKSGSGLIAASDTVSLRGQVGIIINLMSQSGRWGSLAVSFSANANPYFCPK